MRPRMPILLFSPIVMEDTMHRTACCAFAILLALTTAALSQSTLENPGFEHGSPHNPTSWDVMPGNDPHARIEITEDNALIGDRAARISCAGTDPRIGRVFNRLEQPLDATPYLGGMLTVTAMCRTEGIPEGHAAVLRIEAVQTLAGLTFLNSAATARVKGCNDWVEICATVRVPTEAHEIRIAVGLDGIGAVWFDEVSLSTGNSCETGPVELTTRLPFTFSQRPSTPTPSPEYILRATPPAAPRTMKPWTIAVYVAAETGFNPLREIVNELQTCDQYNVILLADSSADGGKMWLVGRQDGVNQLHLLADRGDVDMSTDRVFSEFLEYCTTWFPCERMALLIYDHGGGWRGTAKEPLANDPSTYTWLSPAEIRRGLDAVGGVDALLYTAPCNMASLETAYEVGASAGLTLAAEEYSGYGIWSGVLDSLGALLREDPDVSLETLGDFVIDGLVEGQRAEMRRSDGAPHPTFHQTAYWGRLVSSVADAVDRFASALIERVVDRQEEIVEIRKDSLAFRHGELVDIGDFAQRCGVAIPELASFADAVIDALAATAFRVEGVPAFADSHGLSVFFPLFRDYGSTVAEYHDTDLAFTAGTRWEEFLEALYSDYE